MDDAAGAIMMLACPWSEYITGQVLEVGGWVGGGGETAQNASGYSHRSE